MVLRETSNPPIKSSLSLLAVAGLASAVFTLADFITGDLAQYSVGFIFGLALAIYFAIREGERNPAKIVAFLGACTAAYAAAMFSAFRLDSIFVANNPMGASRLDIPMPVFFGAGCVGAFIVLAAGIFLFRPQDISWNSLGRVLLWSLGGGVLGVMGGGADGLRTRGTFNNFWLLFLVWQPGAAALLGLLMNHERKLLTAPSQAISEPAEPPTARVSRGFSLCRGSFLHLFLRSSVSWPFGRFSRGAWPQPGLPPTRVFYPMPRPPRICSNWKLSRWSKP